MLNTVQVSQPGVRNAVQDITGVELVPGTELMDDVGDIHFKHTGKATLLPQPSDDPNDPLNWSRTWKWLTMSSMAISTFNWVASPLALSPQVPFYMKAFDSTLPAVINFIGVSILVLGFTNLIWVPFSRGFGRRPMPLITTLITTASFIWRAKATTYESFLGACILTGVGAAPGETLGPVLVADVMFLHERGWWMGVYQWAFWSGLMIGPIVSGVASDDYGWRSFWWISTAISAFTNIWLLFFLPETKWDRRGEAAAMSTTETGSAQPGLADEKSAAGPATIELDRVEEGRRDATGPSVPQLEVKLSGKPKKNQMLPITAWNGHEPIIGAITLPLKLIRFPIVLWGALQFNFSASCVLMISIAQSQAFGAEPYNFTPAQVGFTNLAIFLGSSVALLTAGPLGDWISRRATIRNGNVREPEMRLPAMIPFAVCLLLGAIVLSVGFQFGWPWEVIVIVGFGLIGVQAAAISGIAINYVVDCYKPAAGEFLVGATVVKNVWGYGMTHFMNNWIVQIGYIGPLMFIAGLNAAMLLLGAVPLYFWGKKVRRWSAGSSVHTVS